MMSRCAFAVVGLLLATSCGGSSPTSSPSPAGFSLSGQVTSASTSAPIAGATVAIGDGPNAGKSATTDASGNYSFTALERSGFTATASAEGFSALPQGINLTSNQTMSFRLTGLRTRVFNRSQTVLARRGNGNSFTTSRLGRVEIVTAWNNPANLVRLELALQTNCGAPQYTTNTCSWLYADRSPVPVAQRTAVIDSLQPNNYIVWLTNQGAGDESVTMDVYLTP